MFKPLCCKLTDQHGFYFAVSRLMYKHDQKEFKIEVGTLQKLTSEKKKLLLLLQNYYKYTNKEFIRYQLGLK